MLLHPVLFAKMVSHLLMKVVSRSVKDPLKKKRKGSRSVRFRSCVEKGKTKKNQLVLCAGPVIYSTCY